MIHLVAGLISWDASLQPAAFSLGKTGSICLNSKSLEQLKAARAAHLVQGWVAAPANVRDTGGCLITAALRAWLRMEWKHELLVFAKSLGREELQNSDVACGLPEVGECGVEWVSGKKMTSTSKTVKSLLCSRENCKLHLHTR